MTWFFYAAILALPGLLVASQPHIPEQHASADKPTIILPTPPPPPEKRIATTMVGDKEAVVVNTSLPLTGEVSILGKQVLDGMSLFFNKLNKEKKRGLMFHLNVLDDAFETSKTRSNVTKLAASSPLFLSLLGTRSVLAVSQELAQGDIALFFPLEGADTTQSSQLNNIVYFRPNYEQEIEALVSYAVNQLNKKKIGLFYEASDSGEAALEATKRVLEKHNLSLHAQAWYPAQSLNVGRAADDLAAKAPNVIICVSKSRPTYNFIRQFVNKGLHKTIFMGLSGLESIQPTLTKSRGIYLITSSVVPDPVNSSLQIVTEYRNDLKTFMGNKAPSAYSLEGYINAALLYELLKITPRPFTVQGLMRTAERLKHVRFKGLELRFNPTTRALAKQVYITNPAPKKTAAKAAEHKKETAA